MLLGTETQLLTALTVSAVILTCIVSYGFLVLSVDYSIDLYKKLRGKENDRF